MRSLGQFFGHVAKGIRTKPGDDAPRGAGADDRARCVEVDRRVEEEHRDGVILRRTTIEEVEVPARRSETDPAPDSPHVPASGRPPASDAPHPPDSPA